MSDPATPAPQQRRGIYGVLAIAVLALLVGAAVVFALLSNRTESTTPTAQDTTTAATTTAEAPDPITAVEASPPRQFLYTGGEVLIDAGVCEMDYVLPLDPPGDQLHTVCWVREHFGVAPGSESARSYILGHAWAQQQLVFNPIAEKIAAAIDFAALPEQVPAVDTSVGTVGRFSTDVLDGDEIVLTTDTAVLTYEVVAAYAVDKMEAINDAELMDDSLPQRITLIACAVKDGVDLPYLTIVDAELVASTPLPTS